MHRGAVAVKPDMHMARHCGQLGGGSSCSWVLVWMWGVLVWLWGV